MVPSPHSHDVQEERKPQSHPSTAPPLRYRSTHIGVYRRLHFSETVLCSFLSTTSLHRRCISKMHWDHGRCIRAPCEAPAFQMHLVPVHLRDAPAVQRSGREGMQYTGGVKKMHCKGWDWSMWNGGVAVVVLRKEKMPFAPPFCPPHRFIFSQPLPDGTSYASLYLRYTPMYTLR